MEWNFKKWIQLINEVIEIWVTSSFVFYSSQAIFMQSHDINSRKVWSLYPQQGGFPQLWFGSSEDLWLHPQLGYKMFCCICFHPCLPGVGFLKGLHIIEKPRTVTHSKSSSSSGPELSLRWKSPGPLLLGRGVFHVIQSPSPPPHSEAEIQREKSWSI